jgi:hypothetical protein
MSAQLNNGYSQLGTFKPNVWLAMEITDKLLYVVGHSLSGTTVKLQDESENTLIASGTYCRPVDEDEIERRKYHAEWGRVNKDKVAKARAPKPILPTTPAGGPAPGAMFDHKSDCPECGKNVWVTTAGRLLPHGPAKNRCSKSGQQDR